MTSPQSSKADTTSELRRQIDDANFVATGERLQSYALDLIIGLFDHYAAAQKQRWETAIRLEAEKGFKSDLVKLQKEYFSLDELIRSTDHGIERYTAALDGVIGEQA